MFKISAKNILWKMLLKRASCEAEIKPSGPKKSRGCLFAPLPLQCSFWNEPYSEIYSDTSSLGKFFR